jgi:hypothetical protein
VFVVEQNGQKSELWMSKMHPILRMFAEKGTLKGRIATLSFEGKGLEMRIDLKDFK